MLPIIAVYCQLLLEVAVYCSLLPVIAETLIFHFWQQRAISGNTNGGPDMGSTVLLVQTSRPALRARAYSQPEAAQRKIIPPR
ncbi:MAG: hypothetical protein LUG19_00725 [Desulfovibrio sp.]|uniref:hypothetical protein n=1 Tax=Desulfovibrio sp. TaxID=885 RepID=UPI0025862FD5|nr:hypothetical protein [Desulfovibrio sp.]MCD7982761.1 hypothetical protein [Desulfovibrio sp.]